MSLYEIEPLLDHVLLKRMDQDSKYGGIVHLPDTAKVKHCVAQVCYVGPGRIDAGGELVPMQLKPGDLVLIGRYAGLEVELLDENGKPEKFVTMVEDEVLCRLRRKSEEPSPTSGNPGA